MVAFLKKIFGSRNDRVLRSLQKRVDAINQLEPAMQALSNEALRAKTTEFKERLANGATVDDLLAEAFAVVRETSVRVLGMRHFDVQLIGGMVLHAGNISEMKTGEGKTLAATLPAYLNALTEDGVHIVTVNDYLAQRDADWMRPVYEFLGLTVGVNKTLSHPAEKKLAYAADITYGTNNEFGFDYLRDNMAFSEEEQVQRKLNFAIVDEVDSILIDEARTPLIISGPAEESPENYVKINTLIPQLVKRTEENGPGDYYLEEKTRQAFLTENGHEKVEKLLTDAGLLKNHDSLYAPANIQLMHHINAGLRAHTLFHKDVDYVVSNDEVVIVDEHTGRLMVGRRWSDGLHQAVEAKEGVKIQSENQTMASITFQNYFRLYKKLAGMTGTADTEAYEFQHIYGLEVIAIPTNQPMIREDQTDRIYAKGTVKYKKIIEDIQECRARQQPVLVGTIAIETSEHLSNLLSKAKIPHQVLNAKYHEKEAKIVAEAGRPGAVTIATNMAGRGTDIVLGGSLDAELAALPEETSLEKRQALKDDWKRRHEAVVAAGGLRIIGTERHESRRIDNQLRGRSGRQGDPGSSRFYLSLEDNLMRIFASDRVSAIMQRGLEEDEALESGLIHKIIEYAQRKVEGHNFDMRKQLLEYDDVANEQRKVVYEQRGELLKATDISETIQAILQDVADHVVSLYVAPNSMEEQWDIPGLEQQLQGDFGIVLHLQAWLEADDTRHEEALRQYISDTMIKHYQAKEELIGGHVMRQLEKSVMLQCLDTRWREHLVLMDYLRQGIHLRGYAQKNPKEEYKREAFNLFSTMLDTIKLDIIGVLYRLQIETEQDITEAEENRRKMAENRKVEYSHAQTNALESDDQPAEENNVMPFVREQPKVGRNEVCPCGSGKKYKYCHGRIA